MNRSNKLKEVRQSRGMSQQAVANASGIGIRIYQYYEAGDKEPGVHTALKIAKALNSTVEELFLGE